MPVPEVGALDKGSGEAQAKAALSACIATEIRNGKTPDEAKGMCYDMIRAKVGETTLPRKNEQGEIGVIHLIAMGVGCVTLLVVTAVLKGIDGVLLSTGIAGIVALISGFTGYKIGQSKAAKK